MAAPSEVHIVAADHPSLDGKVGAFLAELREEPRYFGPSASCNPKPFPSLLAALAEREGFRLAAIERGRLVGLTRVDGSGQLRIAVVADRRGHGIGTALGRAAVERAIASHYTRVVMHSNRRSRATRRIGESLGCVVVDQERGRTDLIVDLRSTVRSA